MTATQNAIGCFFEIFTIGLIIVLMSPKIKMVSFFKYLYRNAKVFFNKIKNLESPATCLSLDFFCSLLSEVESVFLEKSPLKKSAIFLTKFININ